MSQPSKHPPPPSGSPFSPLPPPRSPKEKVERVLSETLGVFDVIGRRLCGELWQPVYESLQDAIGISLLVAAPSLLSTWIIGKDFSGFDICIQEANWLSTERYACFVVVLADMAGWAVLAGRVLKRLVTAIWFIAREK